MSDLFLSYPGTPPQLHAGIEAYLTQRLNRCRHAFAYISLHGIAALIHPLMANSVYARARKEWVVGLHNGVTEPAALDDLAAMANTTVRVYSASGRIDRRALHAQEKMHAKVICLMRSGGSLSISGSANLTGAALSTRCSNYECVSSLELDRRRSSLFNSWYSRMWRESIPVTSKVITQYSGLRKDFLSRHRIILPRLDDTPAVNWESWTHFWIEAGAMSGGDRNQVEFGPSLATFFGPLARSTRNLRIRFGQVERSDRPLSFKTTQWGTEIWRLSLITSSQGGPSYPGKVIHFTKSSDENGELFLLDLAAPDSREASEWRNVANRKGTIGCTGTGSPDDREFGVY